MEIADERCTSSEAPAPGLLLEVSSGPPLARQESGFAGASWPAHFFGALHALVLLPDALLRDSVIRCWHAWHNCGQGVKWLMIHNTHAAAAP